MKLRLNCWLVAVWFWVTSRFRAAIWTRRSLRFGGLIPHAGTAQRFGWRRFMAVEYVPHHSELWTLKNWMLLFDGTYRVWEFRAVRCRRFSTATEAMAFMKGGR